MSVQGARCPVRAQLGTNTGSNSSAIVATLAIVIVGVIAASVAALLLVYRKRKP